MSILNSGIVPVGSTGGYSIDNSLRFNDGDSAYLSRTPSTAGNRKTWTWSGWVKRGVLDIPLVLFQGGNSSVGYNALSIGTANTLLFDLWDNAISGRKYTTYVMRDSSAWYHIMCVYDSTNATAADRIKLYANGERLTSFGSGTGDSTDPVLNKDGLVNSAITHFISSARTAGTQTFDGYLAEVNFVDGQALTPSDFGETDATYGHWKAKAYTGTYGTNGFYLDFKNSGSLGNDASSNSNNWTPTNLAATDQMLDSPTNNFCTYNPVVTNGTPLSEGNLKVSRSVTSYASAKGTFGMSEGSWYWEVNPLAIIISTIGVTNNTAHAGIGTGAWTYHHDGSKYVESTNSAYGTAVSVGDVMGMAFNADTGTLTCYLNNVSQGVLVTGLTGTLFPVVTYHNVNSSVSNFGQDSSFAGNKTAQGNADGNGYGDFYYTPPTGFLALCTQNLPEPTVVPSEHFNTVLWTGAQTVRSIAVGFQSDVVWVKARSIAASPRLYDSARGAGTALFPNGTDGDFNETYDGVSAFTSNGFTLDNPADAAPYIDITGETYVAWNWKANGAGVSNTDGSITSNVSANVDAGFSIVSYTGNQTSGATVGHGLSSAPEMVMIKNRSIVSNWAVYNHSLADDAYLRLDATNAAITSSTRFNSTDPSSSVVTIGNDSSVNGDTTSDDLIAYCFHSVEGYSKVGSYTGNGSTDGTFVHCGFRPAYVMTKNTNGVDSWVLYDNKRDDSNVNDKYLLADSSSAEGTYTQMDFVANGFKFRTAGSQNGSVGPYIFLAFAEHPFKYTNAR